MFEIEQKFRVADRRELQSRLAASGASAGETQRHADTYYQHPSRDFRQSQEALRIRQVDSVPSVTYKGPKLRLSDSTLKARQEIEWCLAPGDPEGRQMQRLLTALGFSVVEIVEKTRCSYGWSDDDPRNHFTVTLDDVDGLGCFAEIELLIDESDSNQDAAEEAGESIARLADQLGLLHRVQESYLELKLAAGGSRR
ncbi:class IV adenylate cyclase [Roseiconus nitratireducens]|uniref:Class IV adenylate cyclase n=1 Tax=Roseiconus nitratireducens TaxID=2605748 RepID=A0A5M6DIS8_9BACT|nr:class IV adenylate cyclase [Roseiconus nitratireducens]KAA5545175.1 class IV adenylate cyclase [Roseiconus nitratireducens]